MGSFIIGLDIDEVGIGKRIAKAAKEYGVDSLNALYLTPLPGTRLWNQMSSEDRITLKAFPGDWRYYTLTFPVARYQRLSSDAVIKEMIDCNRIFYSMPGVIRRMWSCVWERRMPLINLVTNLSTRNNSRVECRTYVDFRQYVRGSSPETCTTIPADRSQVRAAASASLDA